MERRNPQRKLIGEPVTRPDGRVMRLWDYEFGVDVDISKLGNSWYSKDEVELLGGGDFKRGLL